jgi:hypothetical protein
MNYRNWVVSAGRTARGVFSSDKIEIAMWGDEAIRDVYRHWTARHPRLPVMRLKQIGASLLSLSQQGYLEGPAFKEARRKARRAAKAGYIVQDCRAEDHQAEIVGIHRSAPERQGRAIWQDYASEEDVGDFLRQEMRCRGLFDPSGRLRGYALIQDAGGILLVRRMMGHADDLRQGIMYLLMTETVRDLIANRARTGGADWLQFGMYWGDSEGMKQFKRELGFQPFNVRWRWRG